MQRANEKTSCFCFGTVSFLIEAAGYLGNVALMTSRLLKMISGSGGKVLRDIPQSAGWKYGMSWKHMSNVARKTSYYLLQKTTKWGIDAEIENQLRHQATEYLTATLQGRATSVNIAKVQIKNLDLEDHNRYSLFEDDVYRRFVISKNGNATDEFGRKGNWVPRGCTMFFDHWTKEYVKVFDEYFCQQGVGRFLRDGLNRGLYDFLCPNLSYVIIDDAGLIRGYSIRGGRQLTHYEFERYVSGALREVICRLTERTGLYFYDLTPHNAIVDEGRISLIDMESVLPVEWFGKGIEFSLSHLSEIDIGWPIQRKWYSPKWYRNFLIELSRKK